MPSQNLPYCSGAAISSHPPLSQPAHLIGHGFNSQPLTRPQFPSVRWTAAHSSHLSAGPQLTVLICPLDRSSQLSPVRWTAAHSSHLSAGPQLAVLTCPLDRSSQFSPVRWTAAHSSHLSAGPQLTVLTAHSSHLSAGPQLTVLTARSSLTCPLDRSSQRASVIEVTSPASLLMASRSWGRARSDTRPDSSTMERRDFSPTPPRSAWRQTGPGQVRSGQRSRQVKSD